MEVSPTAPELENRKLKDFVMRMGQIYKAGFFAKKILLIEGASDLIISKCLLQKLDLNIDVAGSQIVPVEGKGQFPVITKMFRLVNKEVCILTDLDGFTDDNKVTELFSTSPEADEIARSNSHRSMAEMIQNVRDEMTKLHIKIHSLHKKVLSLAIVFIQIQVVVGRVPTPTGKAPYCKNSLTIPALSCAVYPHSTELSTSTASLRFR